MENRGYLDEEGNFRPFRETVDPQLARAWKRNKLAKVNPDHLPTVLMPENYAASEVLDILLAASPASDLTGQSLNIADTIALCGLMYPQIDPVEIIEKGCAVVAELNAAISKLNKPKTPADSDKDQVQ